MKLQDVTFGYLICSEAVISPQATVARLHSSGLEYRTVVMRVLIPMLVLSITLGALGLWFRGVPSGFWEYQTFSPLRALLVLSPPVFIALVLAGLAINTQVKNLIVPTLNSKQLQSRGLVAALVLGGVNVLYLFPYLSHLSVLAPVLAAEILLSSEEVHA